jgi:hypothetical protein
MKYLFMLAVASALALPLMGCHASGDVDTTDSNGARHVETKKTTTVQPDGDTKSQTTVERKY